MKKNCIRFLFLLIVLAISVSCSDSAHKHDFKPLPEKGKAPTCGADGYDYYECSCGETKTEPVGKTDKHTASAYVIENEEAATCTADGSYDCVVYCSVCHSEMSRTHNTVAKGHQYTETVADAYLKSAASCTEGTVYYKSCSCGAKSTETFAIGSALGHNYGADRHCSRCDAIKPYEIGETGPAGGLVFYDCDADNATNNRDGLVSSVCGWRYLEAAPEDITIDSKTKFCFGYYRTSDSGNNLFVNGTTTYNAANCTGTAKGTGKANTEKLVNAMGSSGLLL